MSNTGITAGHLDDCAFGAATGYSGDIRITDQALHALTSPQGLRCSDAALSLLKEPENVVYITRAEVTPQPANAAESALSPANTAAAENNSSTF